MRTDAGTEQVEQRALAGGQHDRPRRFALAHVISERGHRDRHVARQPLHAPSGLGDLDRASAPHVERRADRGGELGDLRVQRRLRDVQAHGGTTEIAVLGEFGEGGKGIEGQVAHRIQHHGLTIAIIDSVSEQSSSRE